jgi:hypothetical protein
VPTSGTAYVGGEAFPANGRNVVFRTTEEPGKTGFEIDVWAEAFHFAPRWLVTGAHLPALVVLEP